MLEILPKHNGYNVTPTAPTIFPVRSVIPELTKVEKVTLEVEDDNETTTVGDIPDEDVVITNVLDRMDLFAKGISDILGELFISTTQDAYAPLFIALLDKCENAYNNELWNTSNITTN